MKDFYKIILGSSEVIWSIKLKEEEFKINFPVREVHFPVQIHSQKICFVENLESFEADGLFTREKGVFVGVKTADCVPLMVSHKKFVGALHCGWKGLSKGILENLKKIVEGEGANLKECNYFLGPSIGFCCYFVKEDVGDLFPEFFKGGKLDLKGIILNFLIKNGVSPVNIILDKTCTFCEKYLPSHRRERASGRILTGIFRKK
ncbi:MAG: polyphenol oxidase family protein [Thermoanaerobaculia bacterium]